MTREEELKQIKKERDEIEKQMADMFDLAFMLNNRNDIFSPQAHYEKLSRMVTHYISGIQQSYGYMADKTIEALEQEPVVEPLERLAESAAKTAKALEKFNNAIIIPEGATNGDMIKAMFPQEWWKLKIDKDLKWWDAKYERGDL